MMKKLIHLCFCRCCFVSGAAFAQEAPDALVKRVTEDVLEIVRKDKDIQNGIHHEGHRTGRCKKVLPHFNFTHMTALALGKEWRKATPATAAAIDRRVQDPAGAHLFECTDQLQESEGRLQAVQDERRPTATCWSAPKSIQPGGKPVQLDYSLEKIDAELEGL
jgi:phospholipid transport system substrate-binding protein